MSIQSICRHCEYVFQADDRLAGETTRCPRCRERTSIPLASARVKIEEDPPAARLARPLRPPEPPRDPEPRVSIVIAGVDLRVGDWVRLAWRVHIAAWIVAVQIVLIALVLRAVLPFVGIRW